jgi:adenylosuccinate lyase
VIPQAFLAVDALLNLYLNVTDGMVVYEKVIAKHISEELPFMATETILMQAVLRGGDRQELHEKIREYSMTAASRVKAEGLSNNLIDLIKADEMFRLSPDEIDALLSPKNFIGMADIQVDDFISCNVLPVLKKYEGLLNMKGEVNV